MNMPSKFNISMDTFSSNRLVSAIRRGLIYIMPLVMVGSFTLAILNLPIASFQMFMKNIFGDNWKDIGLAINSGTFEILSLATVASITYTYSQEFEVVVSGKVKTFSLILASVCSFFACIPNENNGIKFEYTSSKGMFTSIIVAILCVRIYLFVNDHIPKKNNVYTFDSDSILMYSMQNIIPLFITIFIFALFKILFGDLIVNTTNSFLHWLEVGLMDTKDSLVTVIVYILLVQILWFFGMHGSNMLENISKSLFVSASNTNSELFAKGQLPTNIITKEFFDHFVFIGGIGCTLGLMLVLAFKGKAKNIQKIGKNSLFPGFFNINELLVFGLPIVFNPFYFIPFILTPIITSLISYGAFYFKLVPLVVNPVEWTTPVFLSGYVSTGSFAGIVLQAINLAVSFLIYLPFVLLHERHSQLKNKPIFNTMCSMLMPKNRSEEPQKVLKDISEVGFLARYLVCELEEGFNGAQIEGLHLKFQPKTFKNGKVFGAEALIRWEHPKLGYISPPVIVALCNEAGLVNELGNWVMNTAYTELARWNKLGIKDLILSINLSPEQLRDDDMLLDNIRKCLKRTKVDARCVELELTEDVAIDQSNSTMHKLHEIRHNGINLSIDDFGMGSSSLLYIRDFYVNVVKIDMSLVRGILDDVRAQEIVKSIIYLCEQTDIHVIAEGVETEEQLEKLTELGCHRYQGFFFSQPLSTDDFVNYVKKHGLQTTRI